MVYRWGMTDRRQNEAPGIAVIVNPVKMPVTQLREIVAPAARAAGFAEPLWLETTEDDAGQGMAAEALAAGVELVLAAGGDGTIRAVVEGLRGSEVRLGLIPGGTGNLLARNLDLPLSSMADAVAIALGGASRAIDVGFVELIRDGGSRSEHSFAVMAGLGIDAEVMASTNSSLKKSIGWLAYVEAGARALPKAKPFPVDYQLIGRHRHTVHVSTVLVGNCGRLQGGIELFPDAAIDDGELDVAILQPRGLFGWLKVWRRVHWENSALKRTAIGRRILRLSPESKRSRETISYLRGSGIALRLDRPRLIELDGDDLGEVVGARFSADPSSLRIAVRPEAAEAAHPPIASGD